jgi:hypothetical protein
VVEGMIRDLYGGSGRVEDYVALAGKVWDQA